MTLDEAIAHEKELAEENYMQGMLCHANPNDDELDGYIENGRYHEQVAKWLEDYKHIKQWKSDIMEDFCRYDVNSFEELVTNVRNKTIDDFVTKIKKYMETTEQATYIDEINNGNDNYSAMTIYDYVDEIANELKAGEQNEQR